MAKATSARTPRLAELPCPTREKQLLGAWRGVHDGARYELLWLKNKLQMRRGAAAPYEKSADEFEKLLGFGCFIRPTPDNDDAL